MKYIKLFESFIEQLNEIRFDDHWIERTSLKRDPDAAESRIIPRSKDTPYGFVIKEFLTDSGFSISTQDGIDNLGFGKETIESLITASIYSMTRSLRIKNFVPDNGKQYTRMKIGKIAIIKDGKKYYPVISGGDGAGGEYLPGEVIWGFAKNVDLGITIKYYPDTQQGDALAYATAKKDSGLSDKAFHENSELVYPYGKDFNVVIDLTGKEIKDLPRIERNIKNAIEGFPEEIEREYVPQVDKIILRKSINPGDRIGVIVNYVSKEIPTFGTVDEIINIKDIEDAQKLKSLDSIQEIKIKFLPENPEYQKVGIDQQTKKEVILRIPIRLTDNSIVVIDGTKYKILGPSNGKPLITAEPSIINAGSVQTWVESI